MATKILDITKEHCPMTFVKTKIELSRLQEGDILEVLLAEGEPLENVPRNAKEQGYNVLSVEHVEGTTHKVTIKKIIRNNYGRFKFAAQCDHCYRSSVGDDHQDPPADG